jgi:hypothetical protein
MYYISAGNRVDHFEQLLDLSEINTLVGNGSTWVHLQNLYAKMQCKLGMKKPKWYDWGQAAGATPLMMAVMFHNTQAVRWLLDQGADTSLRNEAGLSALDLALKYGLGMIVEMLTDQDEMFRESPRYKLDPYYNNPRQMITCFKDGETASTASSERSVPITPLHRERNFYRKNSNDLLGSVESDCNCKRLFRRRTESTCEGSLFRSTSSLQRKWSFRHTWSSLSRSSFNVIDTIDTNLNVIDTIDTIPTEVDI